ncbi:MAG: aminomethyl-transferring glycine dehydrogenase subunit GcvPA [Candidatus Thermoplasmatota archaeon]
MKFIPNQLYEKEMLEEIGLSSIDELFSDIPEEIRIKDLNLNKGLSQKETEKKLSKIAAKNQSLKEVLSFAGGKPKPHYIPAIVKSIISRAEFFTAYTPYQSEASQGFLQAMFEYQSMISSITGMDLANASLYDGSTALGEAALMCKRIKRKKNTFLIPENISKDKKSILQNYIKGPGIKIKEIPYDRKTGKIDTEKLKTKIDEDTMGLYLENPNFFGILEDQVDQIKEQLDNKNALFVVGTAPLSLGILKKPGEYGADIVIGEGKTLGNPQDFGGSTLGIFACKQKFIRKIPGRLIGMTEDEDGRKAFCMTLQTREQHIRRGRATSNICTNQGLCALAATCYLAWLGEKGLIKTSEENFKKAQKLSEKLEEINGIEKKFTGQHFNEFVVKTKKDINKIYDQLIQEKIIPGLLLEDDYPDLKNCMLTGITETYDERQIKRLASSIREVISDV